MSGVETIKHHDLVNKLDGYRKRYKLIYLDSSGESAEAVRPALFVAAAMEHFAGATSFCYAPVNTETRSLQGFVDDVYNALHDQVTVFGQASAARGGIKGQDHKDVQGLAEVVAADFASLTGGEELVVMIDELDRVNGVAEVVPFLEALVESLPDEVTVVLGSRTLPGLPWQSLIARGTGVIVDGNGDMRTNVYR